MRRIAAIVAALALAGVAGCGGDDDQGEPIPADDAQLLLDGLDGIEAQVEAGNCGSATARIEGDGELQDKVEALPADVDADVRSALEDGVDRLLTLVAEQCGADEEPDTDTTETDTQETEPPETDTQPPETDTQPPETDTQLPQTDTQPPQTDTAPLAPPDGDEGGAAPGAGGGAPAPGDSGRRG